MKVRNHTRSKVPRLSAYYECCALYFFGLGQEHSVWFYLFAAWFYEAEDEKEWDGMRMLPHVNQRKKDEEPELAEDTLGTNAAADPERREGSRRMRQLPRRHAAIVSAYARGN